MPIAQVDLPDAAILSHYQKPESDGKLSVERPALRQAAGAAARSLGVHRRRAGRLAAPAAAQRSAAPISAIELRSRSLRVDLSRTVHFCGYDDPSHTGMHQGRVGSMPEKPPADFVNRRGFLSAAGLAGAGLAMSRHASRGRGGQARSAYHRNAGLAAPSRRWRGQASLWIAVAVREERDPAQRALADGVSRIVGQLHAAARTRWNHHAVGPVLRAPSWRCRRDRPGETPPDDQRPGGKTAGVHHGRHQADAAHQPDLLPRMRGQFRHGMARRAAERLPVHARHDSQRDVHRRSAEGAAGRGRPAAERQMADARGRRRIGHEPLAADRKGVLAMCCSPLP